MVFLLRSTNLQSNIAKIYIFSNLFNNERITVILYCQYLFVKICGNFETFGGASFQLLIIYKELLSKECLLTGHHLRLIILCSLGLL